MSNTIGHQECSFGFEDQGLAPGSQEEIRMVTGKCQSEDLMVTS